MYTGALRPTQAYPLPEDIDGVIPLAEEPCHELALFPSVSYTAQSISEIDKAALPNKIRDFVCCALCGRPTPWKDSRFFSFDNDWVLIREPNSIELFNVPVTGAEFYRRIAISIYCYDLIGIWCPHCAAARTVHSTTQTAAC
jgi:hypothetical protein